MKIASPKVIRLIVPVITFFLLFACSKDTDLLADYVVSDVQNAEFFTGLVQDDVFFSSKGSSIILDVLANDGFPDPDKVKIVKVSQPSNGSVIINEDKTLTYTPGGELIEALEKENGTEQEQSDDMVTSVPTESEMPVVTEPKTEEQPEPETQTEPGEKEDSKNTAELDNGPVQEQVSEEKKPKPEILQESNQTEQQSEDNFDYKIEVTNEDDTTTQQTGNVKITTREIDYGVLKAFPTAYGAGSNASGGRGGSVYRVTNLRNSGKGSFRDAVSQSNRYIVFDVSGTVSLTSGLSITADNLTIAGQTAPKGGISITGPRIRFIDVDNLIVRYVRFRPIWEPQ